jgi:hypothetical protein
MGYNIHIARKNNWESEGESDISLDEWLEYVDKDSELRLTNGYQMNVPNVDTSWKESPGYCEWTTHPDALEGVLPWFIYSEGEIWTKYPDDFTIRKMILIAVALNAKVQGEEGEFYDHTYLQEIDQSTEIRNSKNLTTTKNPWWKFW